MQMIDDFYVQMCKFQMCRCFKTDHLHICTFEIRTSKIKYLYSLLVLSVLAPV